MQSATWRGHLDWSTHARIRYPRTLMDTYWRSLNSAGGLANGAVEQETQLTNVRWKVFKIGFRYQLTFALDLGVRVCVKGGNGNVSATEVPLPPRGVWRE